MLVILCYHYNNDVLYHIVAQVSIYFDYDLEVEIGS